ncbi:MAG: alanine racemase, partial [Eubacteriaceae bacterium]|nr:alanine racemase [Eubacteriaceae bacterium]
MKSQIISEASNIKDISKPPYIEKSSMQNKKYRAWAEIDLGALCHNAITLKNILPDKCGIMPVLKANAYGHGDIECAKALNKMGILDFCVATLEEAIRLRKNGIEGDILILGYTSPDECKFIAAYQLTQTVVSLSHASALNNKGIKIKTHIKIDTGMHRLGFDYNNISEIENIFNCRNLEINGMFSHLGASGSIAYEDLLYTNKQIERFFKIAAYLQIKGYNTGILHLQASYGILNYPNLPCDYARAGIALYGVLSNNEKTLIKPDIHPVLSLKARIAEIK